MCLETNKEYEKKKMKLFIFFHMVKKKKSVPIYMTLYPFNWTIQNNKQTIQYFFMAEGDKADNAYSYQSSLNHL